MNFGLLCDDPAAGWFLSEFQHGAAQRLSRAVLVSPRVDELLTKLPGVACTNRWEDLLAAADLDGVIVGGTAPEVWEGARQLASAGVPLLVLPNMTAGPVTLYELSLIRDDQRSILFPCWPHRYDAAVLRLKHRLQSASPLSLTYLHWERVLPAGLGQEISNSRIEDELFRAADLLLFLFGAADQVTTLRTGGSATGALMQNVVLSGRSIPEVTWSIKSAETESSRLLLQTDRGPVTLEWHAAEAQWHLSGDDQTFVQPTADGSGGVALLSDFETAIVQRTGESHWTDVLRAAEVVEAAERSLTRRRTIDLHHEMLSERTIFKSQMTAMGCALLMLTLVLMVGYLAVDSLLPWNRHVLKTLLVLSTVPMFLYLLVQMLLPLTRSSQGR